MGGDFNCHSPVWYPGAGLQGWVGELTALAATLGLEYLGLSNPGPTYISRTPGNRDSVLDLVFVPSDEVLCTLCQRRPELRGPSDHVPIAMEIEGGRPPLIETRPIPRGSDEEADFLAEVGLALELLGGAPLGTIEQLDAAVSAFGNQISNLWDELSKVSKLGGRSKPWWTAECDRALCSYRDDPSHES
ncbi:hypothetical protein PQX77_010297 [Marasmius sp. AFHP31]|nr:hypothetical protein PQX77_010297 [Marasmius sp. AFHP31]